MGKLSCPGTYKTRRHSHRSEGSIIPMLTLKRASKHRPGGPWSDDDYYVFDGDQHMGFIVSTGTMIGISDFR
jgi:hypothetical protein